MPLLHAVDCAGTERLSVVRGHRLNEFARAGDYGWTERRPEPKHEAKHERTTMGAQSRAVAADHCMPTV